MTSHAVQQKWEEQGVYLMAQPISNNWYVVTHREPLSRKCGTTAFEVANERSRVALIWLCFFDTMLILQRYARKSQQHQHGGIAPTFLSPPPKSQTSSSTAFSSRQTIVESINFDDEDDDVTSDGNKVNGGKDDNDDDDSSSNGDKLPERDEIFIELQHHDDKHKSGRRRSRNDSVARKTKTMMLMEKRYPRKLVVKTGRTEAKEDRRQSHRQHLHHQQLGHILDLEQLKFREQTSATCPVAGCPLSPGQAVENVSHASAGQPDFSRLRHTFEADRDAQVFSTLCRRHALLFIRNVVRCTYQWTFSLH